MTEIIQKSVEFVTIGEDNEQQRIDNFLRTKLKGVPKSLVYRIVRKGEVRVNKKRIKPDYKLVNGDIVRIPPVKITDSENELPSANLNQVSQLNDCILYEDERLMVINKPSGMAVHGGSGLKFGLIEGLRSLRPKAQFLELVHRLDRDTSGCLLVAKKRSALRHLHEQLRENKMSKVYHALVVGNWPKTRFKVKAPLKKNTLQSGERMVNVSPEGKPSETHYRILQEFTSSTLVEAKPITGRTHQIRVHCLHAGHSIAGDTKYTSAQDNALFNHAKLNRLFLHARSIQFVHPLSEKQMKFEAPLGEMLESVLEKL
ncbi:23S rRNA pseudouridine(955/2504/2580) synthase RluC [Alteromonas sp. 5E99-2]|uniref:23S rRNA pseudouridine(955/2504/2580) synthase RluC n=1 Tax=Alteromonas sp. 5E99-2 TaxID=2817683 RepID=UPI001A9814CC|nr:23S rRNA pseudouridine(955/2504/2580) synthase RluC [Alteromonas sp. 5E99-2]MBO1254954.1 23S rRNA pseudouridine(955/2504/2580) synthase RluC [Alteromonas sp. 5E99-2]